MLISNYITPVMDVDPNGYIAFTFLITASLLSGALFATVNAYTQHSYKGEIDKTEVMNQFLIGGIVGIVFSLSAGVTTFGALSSLSGEIVLKSLFYASAKA